jgi:hypothetical protein
MTKKSLLMTGALVLSSFSMMYAKSYDLVFSGPVQAGNLELKPGEYTLTVKGNTAKFTSMDSDRVYTAPVKIENAGKKHDVTAVDTSKQNGSDKIQKIELGGTTTDLEFGE